MTSVGTKADQKWFEGKLKFLYAWRRDFGWDHREDQVDRNHNWFLYAWRRDFGWDGIIALDASLACYVFLYAWRRDFGWDPTLLGGAVTSDDSVRLHAPPGTVHGAPGTNTPNRPLALVAGLRR